MRVTERKFEQAFWVVWCPNRGKPMVKHGSIAEAHAEAERLSKIENETFYVLRAESAVCFQNIEQTTRTFFNEGEDK